MSGFRGAVRVPVARGRGGIVISPVVSALVVREILFFYPSLYPVHEGQDDVGRSAGRGFNQNHLLFSAETVEIDHVIDASGRGNAVTRFDVYFLRHEVACSREGGRHGILVYRAGFYPVEKSHRQ